MSMENGPIVVGADGRSDDDSAVPWAIRMAQRAGRPLVIVHATEEVALSMIGPSAGVLADVGEAVRIAEAESAEVARTAEDLGGSGVDVRLERRTGSPVTALLEFADEAAMLVVGTGGKGPLAGLLLGSTSLGVAGHARCPVAVVNPRIDVEGLPDGPIGVAVDGSPDSREAAKEAAAIAALTGSTVRLINTWFLEVVNGYVVTEPDSPEWQQIERDRQALLEKVAGPIRQQHPEVELELVVSRGQAETVLRTVSAELSALVVGSKGLGGVRGRLLGSLTQRLMRDAQCPVIVATS